MCPRSMHTLFFIYFSIWSIGHLQCWVEFQVYNRVIQLYITEYIHIYILFQMIFYYRSLQDIEYHSLCYTVGPCCLPSLNVLNIYFYLFTWLLSLLSRSVVWLFATPWTVVPQAPLSMGFSRQEHWRAAMPSSRGSSRPRDGRLVSSVSRTDKVGSLPVAPPGKPIHSSMYTLVSNSSFVSSRH